ncbi:MAG: DUF1349 domain-containing protein [Geminicoccaceae bacterium]
MQWINEPARWQAADGGLELTTDDKTDFWQGTYYGWHNDTGHVWGKPVSGDFTAEVTFSAAYEGHYDQAGLMLRFGPRSWVKAGVEYAHGDCLLSTVITRELSDWSVGPHISVSDHITIRLTRVGLAVCVQWKPAGSDRAFATLRLGALSDAADGLVGPMACSPTRAGLVARFRDFRVTPPVDFAGGV